MWKVRHSVLAVIVAGWVISSMDRLVVSVAMPFIGEAFKLDNTSKGLISSMFFFGYALFQVPWGILVDKYGARKVGTGAMGFSALFTILSGMVTSFPLLLAMRAIFGVSQAAYVGPSWKANTSYWPPSRRGKSSAIQLINNALGPAFATTLTALLIAKLGWRGVIYLFGIITLFIGLSFWKFIHDDAKKHPSMKAEELEEIIVGEKESAAQHGTNATLKDVIKSPTLWKLVIMWFFFDITYWGYTSWIPSYLVSVRGYTMIKLGFIGALPYYIGAIGIVASGFYSDHLRKKGVHRKALFIPSALLSGLFIYLTVNTTSQTMLVVYMCLTAVSIFGGFASIWGMTLDSGTTETMGISSSCVNFGGQVAGFFAPIIMGKLIDMSGGQYTSAFALLIFGAIAATLVAFTLPKNKVSNIAKTM